LVTGHLDPPVADDRHHELGLLGVAARRPEASLGRMYLVPATASISIFPWPMVSRPDSTDRLMRSTG
jgi:hypothetical protein